MLLFSILIILILTSAAKELPSNEQLSIQSEIYAKRYADEYAIYMKTGIETRELREQTENLLIYRSADSWAHGLYEARVEDKFLACTTCRAIVHLAVRMFREPFGEMNGENREDDAKKAILDICQRFNILTSDVCGGYFDVYWPSFDFIIQNAAIDARSLCGSLPISFCKIKQPEYDWSLTINNENGDDDQPKAEKPEKGEGDIKILQITDIHYDPEYQPGALAVCDEPLCCQRMPEEGEEVDADKLAGHWSDYHVCDAPWHLVENAFDHIVSTHENIQYIYQTGDVIPHIGWKTTKEGHMEMFSKIDTLFKEKFPGIKVFPCLGNHDAHPNDMFSPADVPEEINSKWAYEYLYSLWAEYLPPETEETILKGGYYTVSPHDGFRIIALNNIDCYIFNWWLFYNGSFAIEQLEWLHDTLLAAEQAKEYVHILAHVPSGEYDCWAVWSREYNRIIQRFHHIISGTFNGHSHKDELSVHYTPEGHAVSVAWNGGSLSTYIGKNPNYRVYEVEQRTMQVVDFETWIFNLTAANLAGPDASPEWYKLYLFSEEFTDDLSPAGVDALLEKMAKNPNLLYKFWRYKMTDADPMLEKGCDNHCLMNTICDLSRTSIKQHERCHELQEKLSKSLSVEWHPNDEDGGAATIGTVSLNFLFGVYALNQFLY